MSLSQAQRGSSLADVRPPRQRRAPTVADLDDVRDHLRVSVRPRDGGDVVVLAGEIDIATAPSVTSCIHRLLSEGRTHLLVDLDAVTHVDGAAIRVLIAATHDCARAGGALSVSHHARCERLLRITGETHRITIVGGGTEESG